MQSLMSGRIQNVVMLMLAAACAPAQEHDAPPEIAELAVDALRAAAEVKVRGDVEAVLREHPLSLRYAAAMQEHFALMRELHHVGLRSKIRYPRSEVSVRHDRFCETGAVAHLVLTARVRYDMESVPPASGAPPYTAGEEEHVFRFERNAAGAWIVARHHEINLAEMHQPEVVRRLRNPCGAQ
ncbi:MAG TPA: hypothetical protein VEO54_22700 [Thermoanaerobaculia bacterium]|nr:hypothetical protein [Thermoanaerobaculia bacterium]